MKLNYYIKLLADIAGLFKLWLLPPAAAAPPPPAAIFIILFGPPIPPPKPVLPAAARPAVCAAVRGGVTGLLI